jgi:hypothetical protein
MRCTITLFFCIFSWLFTYGNGPSNPYYFNDLVIEELMPLSQSNMAIIKKEKIIELKMQYASGFTKIFLFDKKGLPYSMALLDKRGKTKSEVIYKFDKGGRLLVRHTTSKEEQLYDSVFYDSEGKMTYYLSKSSTGSEFELMVQEHGGNETVLKGKSALGTERILTLDAENNIIKSFVDGRVDSISYEYQAEKVVNKQYWVKVNDRSEFRLGRKILYQDGQPATDIIFDLAYQQGTVYEKIHYGYSESCLIFVRDENRFGAQLFYICNDSNLPEKRIQVTADIISLTNYSYKFAPK